MKLIKLLFTLIILTMVAVYAVLFTPLNQTILLPYIQKQADINSPIKETKIIKFELSPSNYDIDILLDNQLFNTKGTLNLFGMSLSGTYDLYIKDLSAFKYLTKQDLKGDFKATGTIEFQDILVATFHTDKFKGTIDGKLVDKDLNLKIKNIESLPMLKMLNYPTIFNSKINLVLDYNILSKKGISSLNMNDGQFMVSEFSTKIKKYIKKDLTKEIYKVVKIDTKIDDMKLDSKLLMNSANSKISSDSIAVNLNKNSIKSKVNVKFYGLDIDLKLSDKLDNPKVEYDLGSIFKSKIKDKIKSELNDKVKSQAKEKLGGFLNKLF